MTTLRLATFNLFSGRSLDDGRTDPHRLAEAVASLDAHVLAIQEVDHCQPRSGSVDQTALVAQALGATEHRFVPLVHGTPGVEGWRAAPRPDRPVSEGDGPAYGIGLVSRLPVEAWHVLVLRPPRGRYPIPVPGPRPRLLWIPDEPRAVVAAVLAEPRMTVACTHLSFVPGANVLQLRRVRRWLSQLPGPQLLLGDLNLPGGLPARTTGWTPLVTGPTYPGPAPRLQIDHVLAAGLPSGTSFTGSIRSMSLSDHRAALVDLTLPGAP